MIKDYTFLVDEVRDGFYIPSAVKQCMAVELDILSAIDSICNKYKIKYYAEYGTLLGAVRHGGFIPWDDDLDIGMFRDDLNRFLSVANELPPGFEVHCYKNRPDYTQFIYNVVNTNHISLESEHLQRYYGMPYICGVDIFVMDNVSDDSQEESERCIKANYIIQVADEIFEDRIRYNEALDIIHLIEAMTNESVDSNLYSLSTSNNVNLRIRLYEMGEKLFSIFNNRKTKMISQIMPWGLNGERHYPREYYDELVRIPFENTTIPVPSRYNSMLINRYGDYMKLVKDQGAHAYPCFAIQRENFKSLVIKNLGEDTYNLFFPRYTFNVNMITSERNKLAPENVGDKTIRIVVFLPFYDKYWSTMSATYNEEMSRDDTDVYVIPIPYYFKRFGTQELGDEQFELSLYPDSIELYDWHTISLAELHPDTIYIQNPYDEYNPVISVLPELYSYALRNYTNKLVYIPWFSVDSFDENEMRAYLNMDSYCTMPGIVNADYVILTYTEEQIMYKKKLVEWSGCDSEDFWNRKLLVRQNASDDNLPITYSHKKTLMYYLGIGQMLEYNTGMLSKIQEVLEILNSFKDSLSLYIKVDCTFEETLKSLRPKLYSDYLKIITPIKDSSDCYFDDTENIKGAVDYCDAFYGDSGYVANMFRSLHKPVMIQTINRDM